MQEIIDYDEVAFDAAWYYRQIDALVSEMESSSDETIQPYLLLRRFYTLHRRFYSKIILLTSEETGEIDEEFVQEVKEEQRELARMLRYIKTHEWFFGRILWYEDKKLEQWSEFFAQRVRDVFEHYDIDPDTNMIVPIIEDDVI